MTPMPVDLIVFHDPPRADDPPLTRVLALTRARLVERQAALFRAAGVARVLIVPGRASDTPGSTFGERIRGLIADERIRRLVVMGAGAVPRLTARDARALVAAAASGGRTAASNNRYSSDVCAISDASALHGLPPLPGDNSLPRWLEERAGFAVTELPARDRLALDLDSPQDIGLWALASDAPAWARSAVAEARLAVPRADELRDLVRDPRRELLVAGRAGSRTLGWLERTVRCRVRFLAEERGLRASTPLAMAGAAPPAAHIRPPRSAFGRLLEERGGPDALASTLAELADGAIIDTRVLMADRWGPNEKLWPRPEDRFASDLLRAGTIGDMWLRALTATAAASPLPIALGAHTLVGPGVPLLLARPRGTA